MLFFVVFFSLFFFKKHVIFKVIVLLETTLFFVLFLSFLYNINIYFYIFIIFFFVREGVFLYCLFIVNSFFINKTDNFFYRNFYKKCYIFNIKKLFLTYNIIR